MTNIERAWKRSKKPEFDALWRKVTNLLTDKYEIDINDEEEDMWGDLAEMAFQAFKAGFEAGEK